MSPSPRNHLLDCESSFIGIKRKSLGSISYRTFPLLCHSWDCPKCARLKAKKYKERMYPLFDGRLLWMYTLTYYHNSPPLEVWKEYSKAWNRLRTAAVKKKGRFSYARVLEHHHQSPYPHLHVIADVDFGDVWLAKELKSSGFGYQCRKVPVTTPEAVIYITKYLTKPWTDEGCKAVRKAMHLRIISFGGSACSVKRFVEPWTVVSRNCVRDQVTDSLDIDRTWLYGPDVKKLSERVVDAFMEEIYVLEGELLIVEVLNET